MRDRIAQALAPISERYLRELLRASGAPLHPLVEGVRQDTLENLERTLIALAGLYESGTPAERKLYRAEVIQAKDHARFVARREPSAEREERIEWMLVWLENPGVFRVWVSLRKRVAGGNAGAGELAADDTDGA